MSIREPRAESKKTDRRWEDEGAETEVGVREKAKCVLYYVYFCL